MYWHTALQLFASFLLIRAEPIKVSGGLVEGKIAPDKSYTGYYGIPYATIHKRFQEAIPDPTWPGILKATEDTIICTQRLIRSSPKVVIGQEDCLILNVFVPTSKTDNLRPVMVFIHGGGFIDGSAVPLVYGPEFLIKHDIILVTLNYRLEILGFLCLGIPEAPGNVGLKDQVEALKWVQKNIKAFGGDPDNVTIFGESAGASSVSYHLLSPMSKNLYQRAIIESGSALSPWGLQLDPIEVAHQFAKQLNQDTEDLHVLVKYLQDQPDKELLATIIPRKPGQPIIFDYNFVPCIEKEIPGVDRFLPDHPYNLLSKGDFNKVPIIIGFNSEEGFWFISKENKTSLDSFNFNVSLPPNLQFPTESERENAGIQLKSLYVPNGKISEKTKFEFSRYEGENAVTFPVSWTIENLIKFSDYPVFGYNFTYGGLLNFPKITSGFGLYPGATHADELWYLLKTEITIVIKEEDQDIINKMTTMWTNFAKYSEPTPTLTPLLPIKWTPVQTTDPQLLVIDSDLSYTQLYGNNRLKLWRNLYMNYYRTS